MTISEPTQIERKTLIRAPRSRVWRALTTPQEFSKWFSADLEGSFEPGKRVDMTSTHPCAGSNPRFYVIIERMEPEHTFSWRWHPGSAEVDEDGSTLVEFHLEESQDGTLVTVRETGFDRISLARRAKTVEGNERGWEMQMESLKQYASQAA
ncbi:MAG: SRPBCC family protein [Bryobacteraceae bacterium]